MLCSSRYSLNGKEGEPIPNEKNQIKKDRSIRLQYGALPYRFTATGSLELLLVTTRQTQRWMIPKGWPIKGLKPRKSAAREAFEEAGIRGSVRAKSIGAFSYEKLLEDDNGAVICKVRVFPLRVKRQLKVWPEAHERQARWFEPAGSAAVVEDAGLRQLIASFVNRMAERAAK